MLVLAGCGGSPTLAGCLNRDGFLVEDHGQSVRGSSPHGVNFTLTRYPTAAAAIHAYDALPRSGRARLGDAVVDDAGNPAGLEGDAPGKLSRTALGTIGHCLAHP